MTCPTCGKAADRVYRPFCSRRCADVDLARWLNESYRVPVDEDAEPLPDADEDAAPRPQ